METAILFDILLGGILLLTGFILRRIFALTDRLAAEDRKLHERITYVQTQYVSKKDFDIAVDRIIDCINRLEVKIGK
jgi:hypothetical protein